MKKNIYLLIVVLILASIAFYTYKKKDKKPKNSVKKLISFAEKDAYKWEINFNNTKIICEKISNKWVIVYPKRYVASQNEALANVKNFNTLEYKKVIEYNTNNKKRWGIVNNYYKLFLKDDDDKLKTYTLMSGKKSFDGSGYYVSVNNSTNIYLVEKWVVLALQKDLNKLRDKDFLKVEPEDIVRIKFNDNVFTKQGLGWTYNKISSKKLDLKKVDTLAQNIAYMVAKNIMPDNFKFDVSKADLKLKIYVEKKKKIRLSSKNINKKEINKKIIKNKVIRKYSRILYLKRMGKILLGKSDNNKYTYVLFSTFWDDVVKNVNFYVKTNIGKVK